MAKIEIKLWRVAFFDGNKWKEYKTIEEQDCMPRLNSFEYEQICENVVWLYLYFDKKPLRYLVVDTGFDKNKLGIHVYHEDEDKMLEIVFEFNRPIKKVTPSSETTRYISEIASI